MTDPYLYSTPHGELKITGSATGVDVEIADDVAAVTVSVTVLAEHLPDVIAGMCRAAGADAPIVLERPDPKYTEGAVTGFGLLSARDDTVQLDTTCDNCGHVHARRLPPDAAATLAAVLAQMAGHVATAPDPGQVAELAQALRDVNPPPAEWERTAPHIPVEALARALLRRFDIKERPS